MHSNVNAQSKIVRPLEAARNFGLAWRDLSRKSHRHFNSGFRFNSNVSTTLSEKTKTMDEFSRHGIIVFDRMKLSEHIDVKSPCKFLFRDNIYWLISQNNHRQTTAYISWLLCFLMIYLQLLCFHLLNATHCHAGLVEGFIDLGQFEGQGSGEELADHDLVVTFLPFTGRVPWTGPMLCFPAYQPSGFISTRTRFFS